MEENSPKELSFTIEEQTILNEVTKNETIDIQIAVSENCSKEEISSLSESTNEQEYPKSGFESVQGRRISMEDAHVCIDDLQKEFKELKLPYKCSYYGVYDGHGGVEAAIMCEKHLHKNILSDPAFSTGDIETAFKRGFKETDKVVLEEAANKMWRSGSTVVITIVVENRIYIANVGDSEAVLAKRNESKYDAILLSKKQKPSDDNEKERIKKAGGHVVFGRVMGSLAVSRAIGDKDFKCPFNKSEDDFVSAEPFVNKIELSPENEFLIVACDGLWDKFTYDQAVNFISNERESGRSASEAAKNIVQCALNRGTFDNVTTIVVYLKKHTPLPKLQLTVQSTEEEEVDLIDFLKVEGEKIKANQEKQTLQGSPKAKKVFRFFNLPPEEEILEEYKCSLELLYSGILLITQNYLCFYSISFGKKIQKTLNITHVETIRKHKSLIFTSTLTIEMLDRKKYSFHWKQNSGRDNAFKKILELIGRQENHSRKVEETKVITRSHSEPPSVNEYSQRNKVESKEEIVICLNPESKTDLVEDIPITPKKTKNSKGHKKSKKNTKNEEIEEQPQNKPETNQTKENQSEINQNQENDSEINQNQEKKTEDQEKKTEDQENHHSEINETPQL